MKVNGPNYSQFASQLYKKNIQHKSKSNIENQSSKDRIEISEKGKEISQYVEQIKSHQVDNSERIDKIRSSIKNGTYHVSSKELAKSMVDRINDQKSPEEEI